MRRRIWWLTSAVLVARAETLPKVVRAAVDQLGNLPHAEELP